MTEKPLSAMIEPGSEDSEQLTPEQYQALLQAAAQRQAQLAQQEQHQHEHGGHAHQHQHQHQHQQGQMQQPGAPTPQGLAVATWLKAQDLKSRQCILNGERRELFKVKRAVRALESPEYAKAAAKSNGLLPPCPDRANAENVFKLLPLGMLALRVSKVDPGAHDGHGHAPPKQVKGLWTVQIEPQQEVRDELHFVWLFEPPNVLQKVYAVGALATIMAIVMFPLWPVKMRQGVWYLSMGMLGLIGLFFAMAIFRLILFVITMFTTPPGLWLYPNLFEDVGFFDSFRPVWAWAEEKKKKKSKKSKSAPAEKQQTSTPAPAPKTQTPSAAPAAAATSSSAPAPTANAKVVQRTQLQASVEEGDDSD